MKKKVPENFLPDEIYEQSNFPTKRIISICLLFVFAGLFFNFPIKETIRGSFIKGINSFKACPISYEDIEGSFFLPKIIIKKPSISSICFKPASKNLNLNDVIIRPSIPSFYPPGVRLYASIKHDKSSIGIYPSMSWGQIDIKIPKSNINASLLAYLTGGNKYFEGDFSLEAAAVIKKQKLNKLQVKIKKKNLNIPQQNIQDFIIPKIPLGPFSLRGVLDRNMQFKIKPGQLILGDNSSPLHARFGGKVRIRNDNASMSSMEIYGEARIDKELLNEFIIIKTKLGREGPDGYYPLKLTGTLDNPRINGKSLLSF